MIEPNKLASDIKLYLDYSQYDNALGRYLNYEESVDQVYATHCEKYSDKLCEKPELLELLDFAFEKYRGKHFLGSNRALQWSGAPLLKHEVKMYNCVSGPFDKLSKFKDIMYMLLGGCGAGFSVQKHHVGKLPALIMPESKGAKKLFVIEDSIEGWAASCEALVSSYFVDNEHSGFDYVFDYQNIRDKDSLIAGRFKAPGPDGLRKSHQKIKRLLDEEIKRGNWNVRPICIYDVVMHIADAVISGGVRRSATICLFSEDDEEMKLAKTGNWFVENPQRARSNNSMVIKRSDLTLERLNSYIKHIREFGEPGIILVDDYDLSYNPCFTDDTTIICSFEGESELAHCTMKELSELTAKGVKFKVQGAKYNSSESKWEKGWYEATAFKTGQREVGTVFLLDGNKNEYYVQCTDNHKFALGNGGYIEAKYLDNTPVVSHDGDRYIAEFFQYNDDAQNEDVYDLNVPETSNFYVLCKDEYEGVEYCEILVHNCVEIGMYAYHHETDESGWQGCNLVEINGGKMTSEEIFYDTCKAASILATFQAGYTNFERYLGSITKEIFEQEALIGVSITGWLTNPDILLNAEIQQRGAQIVQYWNKYTANLLGIKPAARCTTSKPSGNSSVLLELIGYPGIKGTHAQKFFRSMQINKQSPVAKLLKQELPDLLEESVWSSTNSDYVISLPIEVDIDESTIMDTDIRGVKSLEIVKLIQDNWIKYGKDENLCVNKHASHNVSNTISVEDGQWEDCIKFIFDNKQSFTGISMFKATGDMDYCQAPYSTIKTPAQLVEEFGDGAILASGLIVDGLHAFDNNFWLACDTAIGKGINMEALEEDYRSSVEGLRILELMFEENDPESVNECTCDEDISKYCARCYKENTSGYRDQILTHTNGAKLKIDWVARFKKFASNYLNNDMTKTSYLMKYVYNWHKYMRIKRAFSAYGKEIDWSKLERQEINADTMGAASCAGGACEANI